MKKIVILLSIILFSGIISQAQNITLKNSGTNYANGDTLVVSGSASVTLSSFMDVTNNSGTSMSIKCHRVDLNIVAGSTNSICFGGSCWPDTVSISPASIVAAGATTSEFSGDYKAHGFGGTSYIRYTFYDQHTTTDTICFIGKYIASGVGIDELTGVSISDAYPNPANTFAVINYAVSSADNSARVIVSDLLGKEMISIPVTEKEGKIKIETGNLVNGIYFYSFRTKDKIAYTKKLIVKH